MEIKLNEEYHTNKEYNWHDMATNGCFHFIPLSTLFKIVKIDLTHVEIFSNYNQLSIYMNKAQFIKCFNDIKEERRKKLLKIDGEKRL